MVLVKTSAQYKFLQTLAASYVYMMSALQSSMCISSPQVFTDCTDLSQYVDQMPYLPVTNDLYTVKDGPSSYFYSDYTTVNFYGFNSTSFGQIAPNITQAAASVLFAACGANSTCTAAYNRTANASDVVYALATTNVNTIQSVLSKSPKLLYFPREGYGYYAQIFTSTPSAGAEIYGMHSGVLRCVANGTMNATTYLQQQNLGLMLYGGFQMYEALIHTAAIGSYSPYDGVQSNINLTAPQVFKKVVGGGGIDTRSAKLRNTREVNEKKEPGAFYKTKWEVWADEARGVFVPNKTEVFDEIKRRARSRQFEEQTRRHREGRSICTPPNDEGNHWLAALNSLCQGEGWLSAALSVGGLMNGALKAASVVGLPKAYAAFAGKYSEVIAGRVMALCAAGEEGFPCYTCSDCWNLADSANSFVNGLPGATQLVSEIIRDVAEFSNPVGEAIGFADAFCGASGIAQDLYSRATACCGILCNSPSCQTSANGCTQGTGVC